MGNANPDGKSRMTEGSKLRVPKTKHESQAKQQQQQQQQQQRRKTSDERRLGAREKTTGEIAVKNRTTKDKWQKAIGKRSNTKTNQQETNYEKRKRKDNDERWTSDDEVKKEEHGNEHELRPTNTRQETVGKGRRKTKSKRQPTETKYNRRKTESTKL